MKLIDLDTPMKSNPFPVSSNISYTRASRCGKHKIFLGMAPGVGKTYKMLDEAHRLKQEGKDVVIGTLETHGRIDIAAKTVGLEVIAQKTLQQGELTLIKIDTDAIIDRQPQLVLIDELAHTYIPGSQRDRSYHDVETILKAGIDVYSTVNIQHLEKFRNLITQITGVVEQEYIPDSLLELANEVVVVDVTPQTLQERLLDGKIYPSDRIKQSYKNLFQYSNLVLFRELVLREAQVAELYRITQIVLRQTHNSFWHILLRGSLISKLSRRLVRRLDQVLNCSSCSQEVTCGQTLLSQIDLHIISTVSFVIVLAFFIFTISEICKFAQKKIGIFTIITFRKYPCYKCRYFKDNQYMKCAVNPADVLTKQSFNCSEYQSK